MKTSQILKSIDFTKTKIWMSRERNIFSSNKKNNYTLKTTLLQKKFCSKGNLSKTQTKFAFILASELEYQMKKLLLNVEH